MANEHTVIVNITKQEYIQSFLGHMRADRDLLNLLKDLLRQHIWDFNDDLVWINENIPRRELDEINRIAGNSILLEIDDRGQIVERRNQLLSNNLVMNAGQHQGEFITWDRNGNRITYFDNSRTRGGLIHFDRGGNPHTDNTNNRNMRN